MQGFKNKNINNPSSLQKSSSAHTPSSLQKALSTQKSSSVHKSSPSYKSSSAHSTSTSKSIFFTNEKRIRLDLFLREKLPSSLSKKENLSNSKIRRLIVAGCVFVNKRKITKPSYELLEKSQVRVEYDEERFFYEKQNDDIDFVLSNKNILFEDSSLIFIDKPAFFPVEKTIVESRANLHDSLVVFLWARDKNLRNPPYVGIMHRLDRTTSGVIVFTKTRDVNKELHEIFESHNLEKTYIAVCEKNCKYEKKLLLDKPLSNGFSPSLNFSVGSNFIVGSNFSVEMYMARISKKSQEAKWGQTSKESGGIYSKTDFSIIGSGLFEGQECFIVRCSLLTGRTHQIRVHLSSVGLCILGDTLYGGRKARRIYLHSQRLHFNLKGIDYDVFSPPNWKEDSSIERTQ